MKKAKSSELSPLRSDRSRLRIMKPKLASPLKRAPVSIAFNWEAIGDSIAAIEVVLRHALGSSQGILPATGLGIRGVRGRAAIPVDFSRLPTGTAEFILTPKNQRGDRGLSAVLELQVPCEVATKPGTIRLTPIARRLVRPNGTDTSHARFSVSAKKINAATLFVSIQEPGGTTKTLDFPPPKDGTEVALFALSAANRLGRYQVSSTLVTAEGNVGSTSETLVELVRRRGVRGPWIRSIEQTEKARIRIRGGGFADLNVLVTIGGVQVPVFKATARELVVGEPHNLNEASDVIVSTRQGVARNATPWRPSVRVTIVPERFTLSGGESVRLTALLSGTINQNVVWAIHGAGKRAARVDQSGNVTARFVDKPTRFEVVAMARRQRQAFGRAIGEIIARPDRRALRALVGPLGGTVRSADGGSCLRFPQGALKEPCPVSVRTVNRVRRSRGGRQPLVAGEVIFQPVNLQLDKSAKLEVALSVPLEPGTNVPVRVKRDAKHTWEMLERSGRVGTNGNRVLIDLNNIPNRLQVALHVRWDHVKFLPGGHPMIARIDPGDPLDEGVTAALRLTGANFVPGLTTVEFSTPTGAVESRIEVRAIAVTADGTKLGLALKVGVMTDLGEGQLYTVTLRVRTPAGTATSFITVTGHDELDIPTGTRTVGASQKFSRMDIEPGATLIVANKFPPVVIECFERADVKSTFGQGGGVVVASGMGMQGAPGDVGGAGGTGGSGAGPANLGGGGAGGGGGIGSGGLGAMGSPGQSSLGLTLVGAGGNGGAAGGGGPFPHAAGDGGDGTPGRRSPFPPGVIDGSSFEPGPGGGGGGGGGGEGWVFKNTGGGGGGGGAGGGALTIAAGEEITLQGDVVAAGGDGASGQYPVSGLVSPAAPYLIQAGPGGGGGGGAGGIVILQGVRALSGAVVAVGGNQGLAARYGPPLVDARTARQKLLQQPQSGTIRIDGEEPVIRGGEFVGPDLDYVYNLLATTTEVELRAPGATQVRVVSRESLQQGALFDVPSDPALGFQTTVMLFEGFNDVVSEQRLDPLIESEPPIMTCADIRKRRFLFLPNTIPFYEFACTVTPATAIVPTERTVRLMAALTARPSTTLAWDVWGSAMTQLGTIRADPGGMGAVYTAPCTVPLSPVLARAKSTLDPSRYCSATISVVPGIELSSSALLGNAANALVPSANPTQNLQITIPANVFAQTLQGFAMDQAVEFDVVFREPNGTCGTQRLPYKAFVSAGLTTLLILVPEFAAPVQTIRVQGHGCLAIQVVPVINSIDPDLNNFPHIFIKGWGFGCDDTTVIFITGPVAAGDVRWVDCGQIDVAIRPPSGSVVRVRTAGGTSADFIMP